METRLGIDAWSDGIDFRMETDDGGRTFRGYAAVFDSQSEDLGGFRETIAPGAFKRSLNQRKRDLKAFVNHDWGRLLGTRKAGTLELKEDDYGLHSTIHLPDTQDGRDIGTLTARGDIFAMSFGFVPVDVEHTDGGNTQRIREARLMEVSPVTAWPAYNATTAGVRALARLVNVEEDVAAEAVRVLMSFEEMLTDEQRELLTDAIKAHTPTPITTPLRDKWAARLAELA